MAAFVNRPGGSPKISGRPPFGLWKRSSGRIGAPAWAIAVSAVLVVSLVASSGCNDSPNSVREIQRQLDQQQQISTEVDYLRDAYSFVSKLAELDPDAANQRITSLLNSWLDQNPMTPPWDPPQLLATLDSSESQLPALQTLGQSRFSATDVQYIKLVYLLKQINQWCDGEASRDPLFSDWIDAQTERLDAQQRIDLGRAAQLFDWTIRNIQLEPLVDSQPAPPAPPLPAGLEFRGAGYRQTTLQTLVRGVGDQWQRSRVFIQLCRQADIDACMLAPAGSDGGQPEPWVVGVLIGDQIFLFDAGLGIPIPGPGQQGIATLAEARSDASVLRRLNVPGWFDYPINSGMVQQTIALLDAPPESMARRMRHLEQALIGDTRMRLGYDVDAIGERFDAVAGVADARLWAISIRSRLYALVMDQIIRDNQQFAFWERTRWGTLDGNFPLALARWEHLEGEFDREDQDKGARVLYMEIRKPEFDIDGLSGNVDLQQQYGVRRELGQSPEQYDAVIASIQALMRMAKRSATFWISQIHYDTGDFENAKNWYQKRVLDEDRLSPWKPAARYNLGRTLERLEQPAAAIDLYKTIGDPQEHGNRIRARLLGREE
jgi:tetratricopeptide (TPR) repeat protein